WGLATRFRIFSILLWGALLCGFLEVVGNTMSWQRHRLLVMTIGLIIPAFMLPSQARDFVQTGLNSKKVREAALTLVTGAYNKGPIILNFWYPEPSLPVDFTSYLRKHHLTIFHFDWAHWEGTKLAGAKRVHNKVQGG